MPNIDMTLAEMKCSYDWPEVFKYAEKPDAVPGYTGSTAGFTLSDVKEVIASIEGENDEAPWICVVLLKDDRFASVTASCDYTGWG